MSTPTLFVGIDVSKEKLEVYFQNKSFKLLNQAGPLAKFMHQLLKPILLLDDILHHRISHRTD